ncbi:D-aminopeptidase [Shimia isoporae]|uniref:D-aminopeptidase n=1 Tax=Shimia isoporae TaxID=647720 RepID=A0A4R1N5G2_9RHOB|nr:P1 family peptidase [Shimia isoporae]TCL01330.1 D-aminopeptidase [Shimia isoporae]
MQTGPRNLITDVAGLRVGNAQDDVVKTGTTVLVGDSPFTCGVSVMGGAPGTRETDLLAPDKTVQQVDALTLSGGSAFGLDASSGVADALRDQGRGFAVGDQNVPIVPGAILFDLLNGGNKNWSQNPYKALGASALEAASDEFALGSTGAGTGATLASHKGGLGSASAVLPSGHTVGALVAVNALGDASPDGKHFWAAPWEIDSEFGGKGLIGNAQTEWPRTKLSNHNTTIAIVATDADVSQSVCTRIATAAHDGMARALVPSHTPMDGDLIFAVSTNAKPIVNEANDVLLLGHAAATCLARAIARAVWEATPAKGDVLPCFNA